MIAPLSPVWVGPLTALLEEVWPGWYGPGGQGCARADLQARCGRGIPRGWVALSQGVPVATVALTVGSYGAAPGETPWLAGLCTAPACRRQGIASRLIAEVETAVPGPLYTTSREAAGLFRRRGWRWLRDVEDGWQVFRTA